MALSQQSVTLTNNNGEISLTVGNVSYGVDVGQLRAIWDGMRNPECLMFQVLVRLVQAGVNPKTATFAQIKTAVEAGQYWWGN